jgi:formylglycine-generating enzyme required for sulfatase activity
MKRIDLTGILRLGLAAALGLVPPSALAAPFITENEFELVGTGDFDGDGRADVVIVEKESGKYRLGYRQADGLFNWVNFRASGVKYVSGLTIGKLADATRDSFALASADGGQAVFCDARSATEPAAPVLIPLTALGPNAAVAVDIGGPGNTPLDDLYLGSIYNDAPPTRATLLRSTGTGFDRLLDLPLAGALTRPQRVSFRAGQPDLMSALFDDEKTATLRVEDLSGGKPQTVAEAGGFASGSDYVYGAFRGGARPDFVVFKPGESNLHFRPVEEAGGQWRLGAGRSFALPRAIRRVFALPQGNATRLILVPDKGETAGVYHFDGAAPPRLTQTLTNKPGEIFSGFAALPDGFLMLSVPERPGKSSTRYWVNKFCDSGSEVAAFGGLASLEDKDDATVFDIHKRIVSTLDVKSPAEMKRYTNVIPGTTVKYVMVPIPGGEFLMGSPETDKARKPDENPPHRVKVAPFWMGMFEVTWNEYELFMYPDTELRLRTSVPTDEEVNKVSDAVARPSKPYVEMSFGMGKDNYPAIAMTHHGANKYCHWLSAKTGHFYRLPTEAEWEYACRAGTTTPYFFGEDPKQLNDYAWSALNSEFKYQKVGRKKPNPWGLHDIVGNVVEWCLDQYDADFYQQGAGKVVEDPWNKATKPYPHAVRGGHWDDEDVTLFRSAVRRGSDRSWKAQDPQLPKSTWWLSDAQWVGFRLVRPLAVPPPEQMVQYWISGTEKD